MKIVRDGFVETDNHPGLDCTGDPGKTDHSQAKECDVNLIVNRFMKTGVLPQAREGIYGDFSDVPDYMTAMGIIKNAEEQFAGLTAPVRKRFGNDPAEFLGFCNDPRNKEEMVKLGLAKEIPNGSNNNDAEGGTGEPAAGAAGTSKTSKAVS